MNQNEDLRKYIKWKEFYFNPKDSRLFVVNPYTNRTTLNYANYWSYIIMGLAFGGIILGILFN